MKKNRKWLFLLIFLALIGLVIIFWKEQAAAPSKKYTNNHKATSAVTKTTKPFSKKLYSINDANSLWVIVNKQRPLPNGYKPADLEVPNIALRSGAAADESHLRSNAANAMEKMFAAAAGDDAAMRLASGFRSQQYQAAVFNGFVKSLGLKAAEASSARPGHSEHQTGLAADVEPYNRACEIAVCFANTAAGKWLAANAYKYGFIIRYPSDKTAITGYQYEPWHVRYVGKALSTEMHKKKIQTMEEFFGLAAAPSY